MALSQPGIVARKSFGTIMGAATVVGLLAMVANPVRSLHTELWAAWSVPVIAGAIASLVATYRYFRPVTSEDRAIGRGVLAATMGLMFATIAVRESLQVIGARTEGAESSVEAVVEALRTTGVKNRCSQFATFKLRAGIQREICVESRYFRSVMQGQIRVGDTVALDVTKNGLGTWVSVVRAVPQSSPNKLLERTREG